MMKKSKLIIFVILIAIIILSFAFDVRLKTVNYTIESPKLNGKIKLALITDLHSCYYGKNQMKLLGEIEKYQPDAVLLGGDIFDDDLDDSNSRIFIDALSKKYKTYYVSGNHEWWSGRMEEMFGYLAKKGVTILRGNLDAIKIGKDTVSISGIDDPEVNKYDAGYLKWEKQLTQAGEKLMENNFNILLAHRPEHAQKYFEYNFDLVLSGHAHGGQFRIPFILNGFYAPNQGLFPKLAGGIYDFHGKMLIVSRGLAKESTRLPRIFNRPEIVFVNIVPR